MIDLQKLKKNEFKEAAASSIHVCDLDGQILAELIPIGNWALKNDELINSFMKWRNTFNRFFVNQSKVTVQSTKHYNKNLLIAQPNRIFFGIYLDNELIGHIGLDEINSKQAQLDNVIRGKSGGHTDLIYFAEKSIIEWAFEVLKVDEINAQVLSHNSIAMLLHNRFGFKLKERFHLKKVNNQNSHFFETCNEADATEKFYLDIIEVKKSEFNL